MISLTLIATRAIGGLIKQIPKVAGLKKFVALRREADPKARVPLAMALLFPNEYLDSVHDEDPGTYNMVAFFVCS